MGSALAAPRPTLEWYACKSKSDCEVFTSKCGAPSTVNKKYRKDMDAWQSEIQVKCQPWGGRPASDFSADCVQKKCAAVQKKLKPKKRR